MSYIVAHWFAIYCLVALIMAVPLLADDVFRHIAHEKVNPVRSAIIALLWLPLALVVGIVMFRIWRGGRKNAQA